ncbi:ECF-type sigma factor [Rubrivirga sp.]|uniref:ECF-type sigma factor n=1 Tax=Rubrivirga sp. TaxID=1885344 RepID=UPI003B5182A6
MSFFSNAHTFAPPVLAPDPPADGEAVDRLFSAAYEELRRLASAVGRDDPSETLNPTALVNEAYLKMAGSLSTEPASPLHFKRIAARAMRQVLVEAARRRSALKRGGDRQFVTFDAEVASAPSAPDDVLALHEALDRLAALDARQAQMVECRFFGGFDVQETAEALDVSAATVARDWRAARAWLAVEVRRTL